MRGMIMTLAAVAMSLALAPAATAQQMADPDVDLTIARPAWPAGAGPRVVVDGGHHNFHTADGRFAPFAALLRRDGFRVEGRTAAFTAESLRDVDILVVANALNAANDGDDGWTLPTPSAFTAAEIAAVQAWVRQGGSLLLVADHMPFAGAATDLGAAFGVTWSNGFARRDPPVGPDIFTLADGGLKDDVVTRGRSPEERVTRLRTFTGSAFRASADARPLIVFPRGYVSDEPRVAWVFDADTRRVDIAGALQGAVIPFGKGRVAVFGEAAMFTAQVAGPGRRKMGFNAPDAPENRAFVLNVLHWLAGVLPE